MWALQKFMELKWFAKESFNTVATNNKELMDLFFGKKSKVKILQMQKFKSYLENESPLTPKEKFFVKSLAKLLKIGSLEELLAELKDDEIRERVRDESPDILVIDSLNSVERSEKGKLFNKYMQLITYGPKIFITVLESDDKRSGSDFWEYVSDIVIRVDRKFDYEYMIRTIEIEKARYQSHVWGQHQLKFVTPSEPSTTVEKRRAHPYRSQGGIFIYPSIHYFLSSYKRLTPIVENIKYSTSIEALDEKTNGGFPKHRCTGFIGMRGGHKSHLGYRSILNQILNSEDSKAKNEEDSKANNECALIISLRDDEGMARTTISGILENELKHINKKNEKIEHLEEDDRLEILYFPPGYITPEEFYHRMFMSIQRLKYGKRNEGIERNVTVLFNSLDQLRSRFPLCAKEQIFIPGIIETLSAENISSIFIAVEELGQPDEQFGLRSMADALISFKHEPMHRIDYLGHLHDHLNLEKETIDSAEKYIPSTLKPVTIRIVRFAGGHAAGDAGILELITQDNRKKNLYPGLGLQFIPFSPKSKRSISEMFDDQT
jgi:KaiC/GvpD/RAD55 family RecA-like ATPase